jgi:hypothetical protein
VERHAFPGYNSQKVKTLHGLYHGKACLSSVKSVERHVIRDLFCIKAGSSTVKIGGKSFYFLRIILHKGMPFCRIIRRKSKLSENHTSERHAFTQDNPQKVKTFCKLSCGKFQYTPESQNLTF